MGVLSTIGDGLEDAFLMAWQVWWALVLGFAISGVVQAWVPRERIQVALGGSGVRPLALATGFGAASSSCSYAAIAIARGLFAKGASAASALAFQFASTNLVVELGIVIWVLLGWQFTLAELIGGVVMIVLMSALLRLFVSKRLEAQARAHADAAQAGGHDDHCHGHEHDTGAGAPTPLQQGDAGAATSLRAPFAGAATSLRERVRSASSWSEVAGNFRMDWSMLWKELIVGFLLAGFIAQLPDSFFNALFITHAPAGVKLVENAIVGPIVAALSFVCSVGNVPLAAVLWSGGIGFAGVIAFIFADLIILPIIQIYRKYYGDAYALRIVALMFVAMVLAALIVDGLFSAADLIPSTRPTHAQIFSPVTVDFTLFANVLAALVFAAMLTVSARPLLFKARPRERPQEGRP